VQAYTNNPGHGKLVVNQGLYPFSYGEKAPLSRSCSMQLGCLEMASGLNVPGITVFMDGLLEQKRGDSGGERICLWSCAICAEVCLLEIRSRLKKCSENITGLKGF